MTFTAAHVVRIAICTDHRTAHSNAHSMYNILMGPTIIDWVVHQWAHQCWQRNISILWHGWCIYPKLYVMELRQCWPSLRTFTEKVGIGVITSSRTTEGIWRKRLIVYISKFCQVDCVVVVIGDLHIMCLTPLLSLSLVIDLLTQVIVPYSS